jgi:hypothetical protein
MLGLSPVPGSPLTSTLISSMALVTRSKTKTSALPFVSPRARLPASIANVAKRPSALMSAIEWMTVEGSA